MRFDLKALAALWLGVLAATGAAAGVDRGAMIHLASSVLKIEAVDATGSFQLGSGVIVGPGKVVTNCHVTRNAVKVHVVKAGIRWAAKAQAIEAEHDLCVLRVPALEGEPVSIARAANLRVGQELLAMGYTGGLGIQLSEGDVVALHRWSGSQIIQCSNWFTSGASGGGLFTADGKLVGILTFRLRGGIAHYFAAPADWLLEKVDDETRYVAVSPQPGQAFWERPSAEQPQFLQAAALEQTRQWDTLARLAERWAIEAGNDAEANYALAIAHDGLAEIDASIKALRRSLEIDPTYSRSWVRLARIYKRQGQLRDAQLALMTLAALDPKLARELSAELEKP